MILFKNNACTMEQVIANCKHASDTIPAGAKRGDIILIAQTKSTLKGNEKSIRYIMRFDCSYEDAGNESEKLWGKKWKYIIRGYGLQTVEPFNIEDIQVSGHKYGPVMTHCSLQKEDEEAVLDWISGEMATTDCPDLYGKEFNKAMTDAQSLLRELDAKFANDPNYREKVVSYLHRPSSIRNAVIKVKGSTCELCGYEGFRKKNSDELYCEVHHMIELN